MAVAGLSPQSRDGVPVAGAVMSVVVSLVATTILSSFLFRSFSAIKAWSRLPFVIWLVLAIFIDSYCFVFATAILQHSLGVNSNFAICSAALFLCLVFYVTTKVLIYLFLVEKAHIIRITTKPRLKSKLYIFNSFGMLGFFTVVVVLNFVFRITRFNEKGLCIIGMKRLAIIPLIAFDLVVNIYLNILFLIPLKNLYSFKHMPRTASNVRLRNIAFRTFVGACFMLISSIANLTVLMSLNGEPAWVCFISCNCDITFSATVVHWVTSKDRSDPSSQISATSGGISNEDSNLLARRSLSMPTPAAVVPATNTPGAAYDMNADLPLATMTRSPPGPRDSAAKIPSPPRCYR